MTDIILIVCLIAMILLAISTPILLVYAMKCRNEKHVYIHHVKED